METRILEPTKENIAIAAEALKRGKLVGMPTETVYGLAANALDEKAVQTIFQVKGRPQDNPLIVHVNAFEQIYPLVETVPETAKKLAELYWSGPLTIILKNSGQVPRAISAGLPTVALRFPSHPVARQLIAACGFPLAAPSANLSGSPSPTSAKHVYKDLKGKIPYILDGGKCAIGLESTVVSVEEDVIRLLRPGAITVEQLEKAGRVLVSDAVVNQLPEDEKVPSPGMKYKHYAPKANVIIVDGPLEAFKDYVNNQGDDQVYAMIFKAEEKGLTVPYIFYGERENSRTQARALFSSLRKLDDRGAKTVYVRCPQKEGVGLAVYNRLLRAAGFRVISLWEK